MAMTAAEAKAAEAKAAAKKEKMVRDLAKLEVAQKEATEMKSVIKEKVTITKECPNKGKTGTITNLLIDRNHVRMNVLLEGRSTDDVMGYEVCNTKQFTFINPVMIEKFGKKGRVAKVADPAKANKVDFNNNVKKARIAMKAGKAVDIAVVAAITAALNKWNAAPGQPSVTKIYGKAKLAAEAKAKKK